MHRSSSTHTAARPHRVVARRNRLANALPLGHSPEPLRHGAASWQRKGITMVIVEISMRRARWVAPAALALLVAACGTGERSPAVETVRDRYDQYVVHGVARQDGTMEVSIATAEGRPVFESEYVLKGELG